MVEMHLLWLRVAAVLYAGAALSVFPAVLYGRERWRRICVHVGGMSFFFHFVSVVEMLVQAHHWMPVSVREIESLSGFVVAGLFFLVWWLYDAVPLGIFAFPLTFLLVLVPSLGAERYTFPSEGLRVSWLLVHIMALLLAYVALGFSMLASGMYLVQEQRIKSKPHFGAGPVKEAWWGSLEWLPPLDTLERIAQNTLEFGFPCMTVGLIMGCVLVQETTLGAAYFLDPKVLAAFASWVVYCVLLLVRRSAGLRGRKAAYLTGAVFALMVVVWVANFFSHVHRYGGQ
jgi:ABC-type uncharacterized transport system permease subunit